MPNILCTLGFTRYLSVRCIEDYAYLTEEAALSYYEVLCFF